MVLVKAEISDFLSNTVLADFISRSGANTVEAGYPDIPRSINMGIRVRLSAATGV